MSKKREIGIKMEAVKEEVFIKEEAFEWEFGEPTVERTHDDGMYLIYNFVIFMKYTFLYFYRQTVI